MVEKNQNTAAKTCFDCFRVPPSKLPPTDAHFGPPRVRRYKAGQWPTGEDPALPQPGQTCGGPEGSAWHPGLKSQEGGAWARQRPRAEGEPCVLARQSYGYRGGTRGAASTQ